MRYLIISLFLLQTMIADAQRYKDGYITFSNDSTLITKVRIPFNGRFLRYFDNGKKIKKRKSKCKDYGFIEKNGEKYSIYAETSFPVSAYDGWIISKDNDTVKSYITSWKKDMVKGYNTNRQKINYSTQEINGFSVKRYVDDNKYEQIWFDKVIFKETWVKYNPPQSIKFLKRLTNRTVKLYHYYYQESVIDGNGFRNIDYKVYILVKNGQTYIFNGGMTGRITRVSISDQQKADLKKIFAECPEILAKINDDSFRFKKLEKWIQDYCQ